MKKRADGRYVLTQVLDVNGETVRKFFFGKTQAEAKQKLADFLRSQDKDRATFKDVYSQYKILEENRIKPAEFKTKCERIEAFNSIMNCRLVEITPKMIALDLNKVAVKNPSTGKPSAKRTLTRYLQAVSNVFEYAEENRITDYNPTKYVKVPSSAPQTKKEALSPTEYKSILNSDESALFGIKFLILTGLRRGEATALQWADIDIDNMVVNVNKSFDFKHNKLKVTKTVSGMRAIPIPPSIIDELSALKKDHKPKDYFLEKDGKMLTHGNWQTYVKNCKKISNVDFSLHQLRHTTATIYYYAGIPVKECQQYMGHSDIRVTLDIYTSLENSDRVKNSSIGKLGDFLANI